MPERSKHSVDQSSLNANPHVAQPQGERPEHQQEEASDQSVAAQSPDDAPAVSARPSHQLPPAWQKGSVLDRRVFSDRRTLKDPRTGEAVFGSEGAEAAGSENESGLERRRGRGRRLSDFSRSAEEGEMTTEQFLFLMAIDEFKKANARTFPQWTDVLEVIRLLGYRKTMPSELNLRRAEDWRERADAAAGVRPRHWERRKAA